MFPPLSKLHERTSLVATTNLGFSAWVAEFGAPSISIARLDRLTHHCLIVETGNEGHRVKHSTTQATKGTKPRKPNKT